MKDNIVGPMMVHGYEIPADTVALTINWMTDVVWFDAAMLRHAYPPSPYTSVVISVIEQAFQDIATINPPNVVTDADIVTGKQIGRAHV